MATEPYYGSMLLHSHAKFVTDYGHSHWQKGVPITRLDKSGTLISRVYQPTPKDCDAKPRLFLRADGLEARGVILAHYQVSAEVMIKSSAAFEAEYCRNRWTTSYPAFIDLDYSDAIPVEIVLRGLHESLNEQSYTITLAKVEQVRDLLHAFKSPKEQFRHWFVEWFACREMRQASLDDQMRQVSLDDEKSRASLCNLCFQFNHPLGLVLIEMNTEFNKSPKSIARYPPILVPSLRQLSETIFLNRHVKPFAYASLGYSEHFIQEYGKPTEFWSDFYDLMMVDDMSRLTPKVKDPSNAWRKLLDTPFLEFAKAVDDRVRNKARTERTVWRTEMEGAWVQLAVRLYESEVLRMGNIFTSDPKQSKSIQCQLKKVISNRFHPMLRVEAYWAKKGEGEARDLWMKKTARDKEMTEMKFAQSKEGEESDAMDCLFNMMEDLQLRAANASDPEELTSKEAMLEAKAMIFATIQN